MRKTLLLVLVVLVANNLFSQTIYSNYQDGKIWVKIKDDVAYTSSIIIGANMSSNESFPQFISAQEVKKANVKKVSRPFEKATSLSLKNIYLIEFSNYSYVTNLLEGLRTNPDIEYIEKVPFDRIATVPSPDPYINLQPELNVINAVSAWGFSSGSSGRVVALVDDAVDMNNEDLSPVKWINTFEIANNGIDDDNNGYVDDKNGFDVADNDQNFINSAFKHGTEVAGVIGAKSGNGKGIWSIGNGISIMAIKANKDAGSSGAITNGYEGVLYAASNGAHVICLPWGSSASSITGQNIINYAYAQGAIIVGAAGNNNDTAKYYPAAYNHVIAVASTKNDDSKTSFSNYGSWIDVSAPGENLFTTRPGLSNYGYASGTSLSAGMVSGLAGLILSYKPGLLQSDVESCLKNSAADIDGSNFQYIGMLGSGRIDAAGSMNCVNAPQYNNPIADFKSNTTVVYAGASVLFTNTSKHSPNSYAWSFPGGSPAASNSSSSVIVQYNLPGTYNVVLTATKGSLSNTKTDTNLITVLPDGAFCDTLNWVYKRTGQWPNSTSYSWPDTFNNVVAGGSSEGTNYLHEREKAYIFSLADSNSRYIYKITIPFIKRISDTTGKYITLKVNAVDSLTKNPSICLSDTIRIAVNKIKNWSQTQIAPLTDNQFYLNPPIYIPRSSEVSGIAKDSFFVTVGFTGGQAFGSGNLDWRTSRDTLGMFSSQGVTCLFPQLDNPGVANIWSRDSTGLWCRYNSGCSNFCARTTGYVFPFVTGQPLNAVIDTIINDTICSGGYAVVDASGSVYRSSIEWEFPGGHPNYSVKMRDTVYFANTTGATVAFPVKLKVRGGACQSYTDSTMAQIVVKSAPNLSITTNPTNAAICAGTNSSVSAIVSGGSGYVWSPSAGLDVASGANVVASPTVTTVYEVSAVSNDGCAGSIPVQITLDTPPTVVASVSDTSICVGNSITLTSASLNANTFSWTIIPNVGVTPASLSSPYGSLTFSTAGTYTINLATSNICGSSNYQSVVVVGCVGIDQLLNNNQINTFYNSNTRNVELYITNNLRDEKVVLRVLNSLGQAVFHKEIVLVKGNSNFEVDMSNYANGSYMIQLFNNEANYTKKIMTF